MMSCLMNHMRSTKTMKLKTPSETISALLLSPAEAVLLWETTGTGATTAVFGG